MAAADLIAERGLDSTKMDDFAAATGVPRATLYYYFEGKEDILSHIFGVVLDAVGAAVSKGAGTSGTAADRLARVVTNHLGVFERYPSASRALHFDLGRAARLPELAARVRASYIDPVSDLLQQGALDGSIRPLDNPTLNAVAVLGATSTAAIHVMAIDRSGSVKKVAKTLVPFVLEGLTRQSTGSSG
jgi:AcrR family transcriptional regulator